MNLVKFVMNIFISCFLVGTLSVLTTWFTGIDPEPMKYLPALLYFVIIAGIAWILKYYICTYVSRKRKFPIALYSIEWEFIMYVVFCLLLPFTGDLGA